MAILDTRWTWADIVQNFFDRTVQKGGVLVAQDDFSEDREQVIAPESPTPVDPLPILPYDKLAGRCEVVDMRQEPRTGRGRAKGTRSLEDVHSIWLHQTAATLMTPERFKTVPAHRAVPIIPQAVLLHPIRAYMHHGHHANRYSLGYEIACRAAGIEGDPRTVWMSNREKKSGKRPVDIVQEASDDQIDITRFLIEYDLEEVGRQGGEIRYIGTHRQSHKSRVSDPGSRLWNACGEWAIVKHGLKRSREYGSGRPNPTAWTGIGREPYSWKVRGY